MHAFGASYTIGISSNQPSITIRNGTVAGFTISGISGSTWIVEDMRVAVNRNGIFLRDSDRSIVRNNEVASNGSGIACGVSCLIEGNIVSSNAGIGISIANGLVIGNSVFSNGGTGVSNAGGPLDGIEVGATGNVVWGNTPNFFRVTGFTANYCGPAAC